jgi:hypothetical protein
LRRKLAWESLYAAPGADCINGSNGLGLSGLF